MAPGLSTTGCSTSDDDVDSLVDESSLVDVSSVVEDSLDDEDSSLLDDVSVVEDSSLLDDSVVDESSLVEVTSVVVDVEVSWLVEAPSEVAESTGDPQDAKRKSVEIANNYLFFILFFSNWVEKI